MSQYRGTDEGTPSPVSSGTQQEKQPQQHDPASTQESEKPQGMSAEVDNAERRADALDVSQALGEIQRSICQLQSTLHGSQLEAITPYQRASLAVLTNTADDIADSLDWLRTIGARHAGTRHPALHHGGPRTAFVLQREDAVVGNPQAACWSPTVSPLGSSIGVAPPSAFQVVGAYGPQTGGFIDRGGDTQTNTSPSHIYPYVQSRTAFPPTPELYHNQRVQTPPVSPLVPAPFFHQQQQHRPPLAVPGPSNIRALPAVSDPAIVLQPQTQTLNTTPNHLHQGILLRGEEGRHGGQQQQQQQQQQQPVFPSPGGGVTMSIPLHYDTPAGTRVALYQSHLPDHHSGLHPAGPAFSEARTTAGAVMQELAAETPPPSRAPMSPGEHRSAACPPGTFARVDGDSDDGLVSPEVELRWGYVFEE